VISLYKYSCLVLFLEFFFFLGFNFVGWFAWAGCCGVVRHSWMKMSGASGVGIWSGGRSRERGEDWEKEKGRGGARGLGRGGKIDSMNMMRMQSSPRPASGRRVVAGKWTRPDETKNCVRKLLKREINQAENLAFNRTNSQEKFRNFHLQVCVCCTDPCCRNHLQMVTSRIVLIFTRSSGFRGVFQQQPSSWG
jgi:hypothetical protein